MPEGPEIRRAADEVATAIRGKRAEQVYFGQDRLKKWGPVLAQQRVQTVVSRGKAMLIGFSDGHSIYSHNQLYGRWIVTNPGPLPETSRQLRLAIHTRDRLALLYSASDIQVLDKMGISRHPFLSKLGPDVLDRGVDAEQVRLRLESRDFNGRSLGQLLTDQSFVAGLGNYLRCEVLFTSGLHPTCRPRELDAEQIRRLAQNIIQLPRQSYATGGITRDLAAASDDLDAGAAFETARFWVFRRDGMPCYLCGRPVQRVSQGGKTCYLCPDCQQ